MKEHRSRRLVFTLALLVSAPAVFGQALMRPAPMIHDAIDETRLVTLTGNTRPEASAANDRGRVPDGFPMSHMLLQLKRSPESEAALKQYIDQLHDERSPGFHQWLTPEQFAARYGVAREDTDVLAGWLKSKGFTVQGVQPSGMMMEFSGTAGQIRDAFHTEIHNLTVDGKAHFANMADPRIPAALAPVVGGVVSMHNFMPRAQLVSKNPDYTYMLGPFTFHALVPGDIATIYNFNPLFAAGLTGQGQSIMVLEDTYVYSTADWNVFRSTFGLAASYPYGTLSQVSPAGAITCANPGFQGLPSDPGYGDDAEAIIDVEWSSAAAPNAAIILAACEDTGTTFGGLIALENVLNGPPASLPSVVSISYGESEEYNGAAANLAYSSAYQQAVAEGVSIFVSSGDEGAASSDLGGVSTHGITVSGFTSTPYNVSVGGLDFSYTPLGVNPDKYWSATNRSTFSSAFSYIQEIPWNDSCAGGLVAGYLGTTPFGLCNSPVVTDPSSTLHFLQNAIAGSGGPSACATGTASAFGKVSGTCEGYAKPSWQSGLLGNPSDGVRDIPDVSLFASNGFWDAYYVVCWSNPNTDPAVGGGFTCNGPPSTWSGFGGTSLSSPIMAGIQALVNQRTGVRWGNPNTVYYALAKNEYGATGSTSCNSALGYGVWPSCTFYDITQGDNDVVCRARGGVATDCAIPTEEIYGVLATPTTPEQPAYLASTGWDFTSGIGSVNAYNLVMKWPAVLLQVTNANPVYPGTTTLSVCVTSTTSVNATGTVKILDLSTLLTTLTLQENGCASWTINPALNAGTHWLTADYLGDSNNPPRMSNTVTVTVSPAIANLSASCGSASFSYGGTYNCNVSVGSAAAATGDITYWVDGGAPNTVPLLSGSVSFPVLKPDAGTHTVEIAYPQQGNFSAAGPNTQSFKVTQALTQVSLTPSSYLPKAGSSITLSAAVTSSTAPPPGGGTVSFFDNGAPIGTGPVNTQGQASLPLTITSGHHSYSAQFLGLTPDYGAGTSSAVGVTAN